MYKNLFLVKSNNVLIQLFRYTFIAALGLIIDFGVLYFLTEKLHVFYLISASISFVIALIVNYLLCVIWIFESTKEKWLKELLVFGLIGAIGLVLNVILIWIFTSLLQMYYLESKAVATAIVYFWNFFLRRYLLFSKQGN